MSNFGGILSIDGVPIGEEMGRYPYKKQIEQDSDGSIMMVVATDAPVSPRNLERMAKRAMMGLARTGGIASNGSGDYVISFSTFEGNRIPYRATNSEYDIKDLHNDRMTPLFLATIEATEEAIYNSLFMAKDVIGKDGKVLESLPIDQILSIMQKHGKKINVKD